MPSKRKSRIVNPQHAVAYVRVSTAEQHLGMDAQRDAIRQYAAAHGLVIVGWHTDQGVSGGTPVDERKGLCAAFEQIDTDGCGVLLAHRRDRIARDVVIAATVERMAQGIGARVVTADGVLADDSPEAALMRTLIDAMAMYERSLIRSRIRAAIKQKKARGEFLGEAPFGMRGDEAGKLVQDENEQAAMRLIATLSQSNHSQREICEALEATGLRPRGKRWHNTTIARIQKQLGLNDPERGPRGTKWALQ